MSTETWPRANPPDPAAAAADQWVALGPAVTLNVAASGHPRVSGTITDLQVSADGQRVYAGTALGGLWYSGDAGGHWRSLDFYASARDGSGNLVHSDTIAVGAVAVTWNAENTDVVYAGPGGRPPIGREPPATLPRGVGLRSATGPAAKVAASGPAADPWLAEGTDLAALSVTGLAIDRVNPAQVWAATNKGLYRRQASGGSWQHVDPGLGSGAITDVVVVAGLGVEPERVYVASADGRVARSTDGTTWTAIALPGYPGVAASIPVERIVLAAGNITGHAVVWVLAGGPRLWRMDGDTAEVVAGVPADLFALTGTATMALAVHPDPGQPDRIAIGGGAVLFPAGIAQAALYLGQVTRVGGTLTFPTTPGPAGQPQTEWVGSGIPAGVRALAFVPGAGPAQMWVGGTAGVFGSVAAGVAGSFTARVSGLATVALNSLAIHPFSDGMLICGSAGLGALRRAGVETWQAVAPGLIGGAVIDPADPRKVYVQSAASIWNRSLDGGATFADLGYQSPPPAAASVATIAAWSAAQSDEAGKSAASSRIAAISGPHGTQLALGTDRLWYADDAAISSRKPGNSGWVTLPSLNDPYDSAAAAPARAQDQLDGPVLVPRWGSPDRLYVLTRTSVYAFTRTAGVWAQEKLYDQVQVHRNWKGKVPSGQIPDDTPLRELAVHQAGTGKGTLYAGTAGPSGEDHLWWFDGTSKWLPAGLPTDLAVHAVAVDPAHLENVYAGTDLGVWKGVSSCGSTPTWTWTQYSGGLPEAPCVDLAVFAPGGTAVRLLRGAFAGRGVYEVALDGGTQGPQLYVRADPASARRGTISPGGSRDPVSGARAQVRLDASPDIRVWRPPAAIQRVRHLAAAGGTARGR